MAHIINQSEEQKGKVEKFSFAKLDVDDKDLLIVEQNPFAAVSESETSSDRPEESMPAEPPLSSDERRELMEKIDQLTSDVVRLQMELEKHDREHENALEAAKREAYEKGKEEALTLFQQEQSEEIEALKTQLIRSITLLDEEKHHLEASLQRLEKELTESAFLIAKKVIRKEVEKHSAQIATEIARFLLKNVKESSDVTLKVNPEDFNYLSSQLKETLIKIEADEAIQKGGVVILGGEENIDGNILTRYKQALQFLQKES